MLKHHEKWPVNSVRAQAGSMQSSGDVLKDNDLQSAGDGELKVGEQRRLWKQCQRSPQTPSQAPLSGEPPLLPESLG